MTDDENEIIAGIARLDRDGALTAFKRLQERMGQGPFREAFFDLLGAAPDGGGPAEVELLRAGAFLRAVGKPPPMLIPGLIPQQAIILLTGKPKFGKTLLALDLADAVCTGGKVFGHFDVSTPGPVLYLGMEDGKYEIANRLLKRGILWDDARDLFVCPQRFTVSTSEGMDKLHRMYEIAKAESGRAPVLAIIDTARESLGIKEWNDPAEVGEKIRPVREGFARQMCSVLLVGHNRKQDAEGDGDEIAGSNAFASSVDGWISDKRVEKLENKNRRHYLSVVGRAEMQGEYVVEMDTNNLHFRLLTDEDLQRAAGDRQRAALERKYAALLTAVQGGTDGVATIGEIAKSLGQEERTTRYQVADAERDGLVERSGNRSEGRGRPSPLYRVVELRNYGISPKETFPNFRNSPSQNAPAEAAPEAPAEADEWEEGTLL